MQAQKETMEDRKTRAEKEAEAERQREEEERRNFVLEKLEERRRASMDELRRADSKSFHLETVEVLREQMAEKDRKRCQEMEAERVFEALRQEDLRHKQEREHSDFLKREAMKKEICESLREQIEEKKKTKKSASAETESGFVYDEKWVEKKRETIDLKTLEAAVLAKKHMLEEEKRKDREETDRLMNEALQREQNRSNSEKIEKNKRFEAIKRFQDLHQLYDFIIMCS